METRRRLALANSRGKKPLNPAIFLVLCTPVLISLGSGEAAAQSHPETTIEIPEKPDWNDEWKVGKSYFVTWAHLQACIDNDRIRSLDALRDYLAYQYSPNGDGMTMWQNVQRKGLVAPRNVSTLVTDVYWPHHREKLLDADPVCVAGKKCCCKGRATWGLYVRLDDRAAAFKLLNEMKNLEDATGTCMGFDRGGVRMEGLDKYARMKELALNEDGPPSAGEVVGWLFLALFLLFLILFAVYLCRNPHAVRKIKQFRLKRSCMERSFSRDRADADLAAHDAQQLAQFNAAAFNTEYNKTPICSPPSFNKSITEAAEERDSSVEITVVAGGRNPLTQMPQQEAQERRRQPRLLD